jgi:hypothetical protein
MLRQVIPGFVKFCLGSPGWDMFGQVFPGIARVDRVRSG